MFGNCKRNIFWTGIIIDAYHSIPVLQVRRHKVHCNWLTNDEYKFTLLLYI